MQTVLLASVWHYVFGFVLFVMAVFLIGLILLQRGRGGGLTGALGGAGGQSAFGAKTGDVYTRVTIVAATVWLLTIVAADKVLTTSTSGVFGSTEGESKLEGADGKGADKKATDGKATNKADEGSSGAAGETGAAPSDSKPAGGEASAEAPAEGGAEKPADEPAK